MSCSTRDKVHIFWEGHKILRNLHCRFDRYYIGKIYGGDFRKLFVLLRIPYAPHYNPLLFDHSGFYLIMCPIFVGSIQSVVKRYQRKLRSQWSKINNIIKKFSQSVHNKIKNLRLFSIMQCNSIIKQFIIFKVKKIRGTFKK